MEKKIRIEKATPGDAEILAELSKQAFHTDPGKDGGPPGYDSPKFQIWGMDILTYYKILLDKEIVGGIILNTANVKHHILERIYVDPRYHNEGIATKVIKMIFNKYSDVIWTLDTPEWNKRTRHLYEKLDFNQIGWETDNFGEWRGIYYQRATDKTPSSVQNIIDLIDGMTEVVVDGEITLINPSKKVKKDGKELTVANVILRDKTGEIILVLWNERISQVKIGVRFRIELGYVNSFNNRLQLNIGYGRLIELL